MPTRTVTVDYSDAANNNSINLHDEDTGLSLLLTLTASSNGHGPGIVSLTVTAADPAGITAHQVASLGPQVRDLAASYDTLSGLAAAYTDATPADPAPAAADDAESEPVRPAAALPSKPRQAARRARGGQSSPGRPTHAAFAAAYRSSDQSLARLGKRFGVSDSTVRNWRRGAREAGALKPTE